MLSEANHGKIFVIMSIFTDAYFEDHYQRTLTFGPYFSLLCHFFKFYALSTAQAGHMGREGCCTFHYPP